VAKFPGTLETTTECGYLPWILCAHTATSLSYLEAISSLYAYNKHLTISTSYSNAEMNYGYTGGGQNNGNRTWGTEFVLAIWKELQFATMNAVLPFVYSL
jgi:hypothetical protein